MPPRKRRRTCTPRGATATVPSSTTPTLALPTDLLAEIVARSDVATVVRCAASCKLLRREILSPAFMHRVCQRAPEGVVPPRLVGFPGGSEALSLVHPATPTAASFADNHLAPFVSRSAAGLLDQYEVVTSRGGLAVLERRKINRRRRSERRSDLCVYDPMTGDRAFFPFPPDISRDPLRGAVYTYVVVTAADGIGCSFVLLAADMTSLLDCWTKVKVQTVSSSDASGQWSPVKYVDHRGAGWCLADTYNSVVVLRGVVHWLMHTSDDVFTYDVVAGTPGTIGLPDGLQPPESRYSLEAKLGALPDGRLTLLVADEFTVSVWALRLGSSWPDWEPYALIDTEAAIRSVLDPEDGHGIEIMRGRGEIELMNFGDQRSGAAFLQVVVGNGRPGGRSELLVLDMETREIRRVRGNGGFLYEVDLASRLSAMKIFWLRSDCVNMLICSAFIILV